MTASKDAPPTLKRILVIKLADLGDAILATSAIAALRANFPEATIDVLTTSTGAIAFHLCPALNRVIVIDKHAFDNPRGVLRPTNGLHMAQLVLRLRRSRYDAIVLLQHLTTSFGALKYRWLCRGIGAPIRAGLDNGQGDFLTHPAVDYGFGVKTVHDYNLDVVAQIGASTKQPHPAIAVPENARRAARDLLAARGVTADYVVIHPSVGGYSAARNWYPERFADVARSIVEQTKLAVVLVGAADAAEAAKTISATSNVVNLVGHTTFPELAAIVDDARLVIGADSGVAHLAAALDTPTLAIFGPSNYRAWKPFAAADLGETTAKLPASTAFAIHSDLPCSPCLYTGYVLGRREGCHLRTCLDRISSERVAKIAIQILSENRHLKSANPISAD